MKLRASSPTNFSLSSLADTTSNWRLSTTNWRLSDFQF